MAYSIIGVHGRAPKPAEPRLREWWHAALIEGLRRNERRTHDAPLDFTMAYYADLFAPAQPDHENDEPYTPADGEGRLTTYEDGWFDRLRSHSFDTVGGAVDGVRSLLGWERFTDKVLEKTMADLFEYYDQEATRDAVRKRLEDALAGPLQRQERIMVVAHSMGSIVAYDVLRKLGRERPGAVVHHLITIGSPLGLPYVKHKVQMEKDLVRTPSCVRRWTNFADRGDWVAFDTHLADDYAPNDQGIKVEDDLVINGYRSPAGKANEHKSYGYLRTPELSQVVRAFV